MSDVETVDNENEVVSSELLAKVKELRSTLLDFKAYDPTGYILSRFILKNYELSDSEFLEKFQDDQTTREETRKKEEHRKNNVLTDVDGWSEEDKQNLLIRLTGNGTVNTINDVKNEVQ
jgi:hypothetical protein